MMRINDAPIRRVALVLKLSDILTGHTIAGGRDITVVSGDGLLIPIVKQDGYFVFMDRVPNSIKVKSKAYRDAEIPVDEHAGGVLRFALIPRFAQARAADVPDGAYVGFASRGYALREAVDGASLSVHMRKEDFVDVTSLYHAIITPSGVGEAVFLEKNLGDGRYCLRQPPNGAYAARGTRLVALHRTAGGRIPVPAGESRLYIMREGIITTEDMEEA